MISADYLKKLKQNKLIKYILLIVTIPIWISVISVITNFIFKLGVLVGSYVNVYTNCM